MARKLRFQYEGAIYHITVRGNGRRKIFFDESDRDRLLWRLAESADTYDVRVYSYCLMDNHIHLLLETPRANISRFMQSLLTGYTVYFNLRHRHSGHLFQGRYGAQLVNGDSYLLSLSRYIHLNPVHIKTVQDLDQKQQVQYLRSYKWSSYRGYIDEKRASELIEYGPILGLLKCPKRARAREYRKFVERGLIHTDDEFSELMQMKPRGIGSIEFRSWVDAEYRKLRENQGSKEDVSFRQEAHLRDVDGIIRVVAESFSVSEDEMQLPLRRTMARPVAVQMLCKYAGLTQRDAGSRVGYQTGAAASLQIKRLRETSKNDNALIGKTARIEKQIRKLD